MLTLILGGARSGKSRLAQRLAAAASRVTYVATAEAGPEASKDAEMAARIERHRAERPGAWRTIEEPVALADAVQCAENTSDAILVDCLTVWLGNLFWKYRDAAPLAIEDAARAELDRIAAVGRRCHVILVSNELGSGTVPEPALTRAFRDTQGLLNQWAADAADQVILTIAGLPLYLKSVLPKPENPND
jgi:adenosylcobinamide kinase/adenosylcobinamide-phosphate guanylyltransferase